MRTIIKTKQPIVKAWQLGQQSRMEQRMIREGKIRILGPERYEVFSQEALGKSGEIAAAGDYFKVDNAGFPYPNEKAYFEENHIHLGGEDYRQIPRPLKAWLLGDPVTEEIDFLLRFRELQITPEQPAECFRAPLWGSILTAAPTGTASTTISASSTHSSKETILSASPIFSAAAAFTGSASTPSTCFANPLRLRSMAIDPPISPSPMIPTFIFFPINQ